MTAMLSYAAITHIAAWLLLAAPGALLLAGCASHNMRDTVAHGDIDKDGCIAYRCQMYCKADATPEQIAAFQQGTVDPEEAKQLKRLGGWLAADAGTTIAALSLCEAVKEANPIIGSDPSAGVVIAYNGIAYWISKRGAEKSPEWCSSARPIRIAANIRVAASINNAVILGICH
jgi:hypothetical protein